MDRRSFLVRTVRGGSILLVLPAGWAIGGCGGNSNTTGENPGGAATGLRFTSDTTGGHTHDFTIAPADFTNPPAAGVSGQTTVTAGHSHFIALSESELATIHAGQAVTKSTSIVDGHVHTFKFELVRAQPT